MKCVFLVLKRCVLLLYVQEDVVDNALKVLEDRGLKQPLLL